MKKFILILIGSFLLFMGQTRLFAQPNSVELQNGAGIFISSHSSIEEAYNAIPDTISQSYIIEILAAYTGANELFPIDLNLLTGSSASNTVTIRPDAGNTGEVISSSNTLGIINISDADYIIIDGRPGGIGTVPDLTITNTITTGLNSNTIGILNGASNCIVRYCNTFNATQNTTGPKNIEIGADTTTPRLGNNNNVIEHCMVSGGRTGIGIDGTLANPNTNTRISNCTIVDFGFNAVWLLNGTSNTIVEDCFMTNNGVSVTNPSGINIQSTVDGYVFNIRRNKIIDIKSTSTSATGLTVRGINTVTSPGTGSVLNIENNFIALNANNNFVATTFGILTTGTAEVYTANIYYNTILIGGTQTNGGATAILSAGIMKTSTVAGLTYRQKNNISVNRRTGGPAGAKHTGSNIEPVGTLEIDYNCYFADGGANAYHAMWDSIGYNVLATYKAAATPNEQNSVFKNVNFVSSIDLHLTGASIGDPDLIGTPITGITTDIDGQPRSATAPYKGADEPLAVFFSTLNLKINLQACSPARDTITVLLRDTASPYTVIDSARGVIDSNGAVSLSFKNVVNGVRYYIVVKHRNSIETWSKAGGETFTGGFLNYDFTTSASQAFGNNQILVGSKWSIYTGDVQQDGIVDAADLSLIDNDAFIGATGYRPTDLNCDDFVDATDLSFADNNVFNGVQLIRPQ